MGSQGIRVGAVLGAPVLLRWSWFVVVGVVTVLFAPWVSARIPDADAGRSYLVAAAFALVLFGSVFLHELAHAVTARAVGSPPAFIVLDIWGGHTAFSSELITPARSILVAAAGPLTNVLLMTAGLAVRPLVAPDGVAALLVFALTASNGFVAAFNALPGLPLDGGRILEGVVWAIRGERAAGTLAAGWGGRVVAALLAGFALLDPLLSRARPDLILIASLLAISAMLWRGATQTIRLGRWRRHAPGVSVHALLRPAIAVPAGTTVAQAREAVRTGAVPDLVVLGHDGRPAAVLDRPALFGVPQDRVGDLTVLEVARPLPPGTVLGEELTGEPLVERMQQAPHPQYVAVDATGAVLGIVHWRDVAARLAGR